MMVVDKIDGWVPPPFKPVGVVRSCYTQKFGIPRQPGLVPEAPAVIELLPPWNVPEAVAGLEAFSHIWVLFWFHAIPPGERKPTVRPPRLGGNRRLGVFATRSTHRPNPVGFSALALREVRISGKQVELVVAGADLLDNTPVMDIKPYIPYADSHPAAKASFADTCPEPLALPVVYSGQAEAFLNAHPMREGTLLRPFIAQILLADPRPAYHEISQDSPRAYAMQLFDLNIGWQISALGIEVTSIEKVVHPSRQREGTCVFPA